MTREEFIGIAADAILRARGLDPDKLLPGFMRINAVRDAEAALDAVGAWETYEALMAMCSCEYGTEQAVRAAIKARAAIAKAEGR